MPPLPPVGLLPVGLLRRLPTLVFGADGRSLPCVLEQHALSYLDVIWLAALRACSRGLRAFVNGYLTRAPELTLASPTHEPGPFRNAWRQAFDMVDDARALTYRHSRVRAHIATRIIRQETPRDADAVCTPHVSPVFPITPLQLIF